MRFNNKTMRNKTTASFSINIDIYKEYIKICKKKGFKMSKRIENFMLKDTEIVKGINI